MKRIVFLVTILFIEFIAAAQPCKTIVFPQLSESTRKDFEQKLAVAKSAYDKDSANADAITWYGRRTAYLGHYQEAIDIFSKGILQYPGDARLYRHRGHRYITVRCFDKAIDDFKKAALIIKGKPDEMEPDGLPNAKNIPTSTLQSNIWYHLGLAYFIKGEDKKALKAYQECLKVSTNKDMYVATANWLNLVYRKMKKYKQADALYNNIPGGELIENKDYLLLLEMHAQKRTEQQVDEYATRILPQDQSLGSATLNFGIGYYCLLYGYNAKAESYFRKAIATNQWSSFGFIAAEAELKRMKKST